MTTIRIIKKERKRSFTERLEDIARALTEKRLCRGESPPVHSLEEEVRLTLDELDRWRTVHRALQKSLRREEFDLEQEIEHLDVTRRYQFPHFQRERLKRELRKLEKERRQLVAKHEERLLPVHDRLLSLLNKRRYLKPEDGNRKTTENT